MFTGFSSGAGVALGDHPHRGPVRAEAGPDPARFLETFAGEVDGVAVVAGVGGESAAGVDAGGDEGVDGFVAFGDLGVAGASGAGCGLLHDNLPFSWLVG
jgi:hypothetical protein